MPSSRVHAAARSLCVVLLTGAAAPMNAQTVVHAEHAAVSSPTPTSGFGHLRFPTSATPAAHAAFERGVLYLHNFHYPQAVETFRRARALDSGDVMSVAFEALAYTHPVWNQQDTAAARAALRALAPTRTERLAKARTARERAWLDAVESLYDGDTPKATRDTAFSRSMARLHASDPRDPEAATFYALSLLGLNQGDREATAYAQAEAIADTVLRAVPRHPGALHYKIHAVDDPSSARRGIAAARLYGEVAPAAGHALHMTSHIHIALGDWDDVVAANLRSAATTPHVFGHGTWWLVYGLLQQGRLREARAWTDSVLLYQRAVAAGVQAARGREDVGIHAILVPATYVMDAEAWDTPLAHSRPDTIGLRGVGILSHADFFVGYAAARRAGRLADVAGGSRRADRLLADSMLARLAARITATRAAGARSSALGEAEVMEQMLRAEMEVASQHSDSAVTRLRAAAAQLEALPFAFGPPTVVKPPRERAAELLLRLNRPAEALTELDLSERTAPLRATAQLLRARALLSLRRNDEARRVYTALATSWHASDVDSPWLPEVRWGRGDMPDVGRGGSAAAARSAIVDTVTYSSGELRLHGASWRPASTGRHPAIVILHGSAGCWRPSGTDWLGRLFAAHGYVTFFPCRRGQGLSQGQGEAVQDQVQREGGSRETMGARATELLTTTQLGDVRAAIADLRSRSYVDPSRVAVSGVSYGGILTILAAADDSTLRAAIPFAPAAMNWEWNAALKTQLLAAAQRTRVPTLLIQAENDWSTGPSRELPSAVQAGGGEATAHVYPALGGDAGTGHGFFTLAPDAWRDEVFSFLDAGLKSRAAPSRDRARR